MKKKKIFLGAYINHNNAQNINCLSIALNLNKDKFDVKTLITSPFDCINLIKGVRYIRVYNTFFNISNFFAFFIGILWSDVSYIPKHHSTPIWVLKVSKLFNIKLFTTIEGNMCDQRFKSMIDSFGSKYAMKKYFELIPNIFGITPHIIKSATCGVDIIPTPLYLGLDYKKFCNKRVIKSLKNIVFIGSLTKRKRISEILDLANNFRSLRFHIIGSGSLKMKLESIATSNVIFHGHRNHAEIVKLLNIMDLNILLSHSEGFPKVILETAAASIPSLVYDSYGIDEIIKDNKNGFVISTNEQAYLKIKNLIQDPLLLKNVSKGAFLFSQRFDWKLRIKQWEDIIENLV